MRENEVLKNMAKWTKIQDTQITIPQNTYASIYMMAKLHVGQIKGLPAKSQIPLLNGLNFVFDTDFYKSRKNQSVKG